MWILKPGHKVALRNRAVAKVLSETEDGTWIRVQYLESEGDAPRVGAEDLDVWSRGEVVGWIIE